MAYVDKTYSAEKKNKKFTFLDESDVEKGTSSFALFFLLLPLSSTFLFWCSCVVVCGKGGKESQSHLELSVSLYLTSERAWPHRSLRPVRLHHISTDFLINVIETLFGGNSRRQHIVSFPMKQWMDFFFLEIRVWNVEYRVDLIAQDIDQKRSDCGFNCGSATFTLPAGGPYAVRAARFFNVFLHIVVGRRWTGWKQR
jgi:hypothetical protein